jgi:hypothetical protein
MEANPNLQGVYQYVVEALSLGDRLQLASLILNGLTQPNVALIDSSDTWTEQDQTDVAAFALSHAANCFSDAEELV